MPHLARRPFVQTTAAAQTDCQNVAPAETRTMVLFLDIDGVMIPFDGSSRNAFSTSAIEAVRLLQADGCRTILHSAWRHYAADLDRASQMFRDAGLRLDGVVDPDEPSKATAIVRWLLDEYAGEWPEQVLVIDDDPVDVPHATLIRADYRVGLTTRLLSRGF